MGNEGSAELIRVFRLVQNMRTMKVLLVNPPIYDFTVFDFWLRPYGMLQVARRMQHSCRLHFFNFLVTRKTDAWGRGRFEEVVVSKPHVLKDIPRKFRRFGKPRRDFREFLQSETFDAVLIQTYMTYWYPGVREVIEDVRALQPSAIVVLGGVYATLCPSHARSLGADLVVEGAELESFWQTLSIEPEKGVPYWPTAYGDVGILKLTEGCPFHCTYCSTPLLWPGFANRSTEDCLEELRYLEGRGFRNIAFYDDALLFQAHRILLPFLKDAVRTGVSISFHTPNALNARFMTSEAAGVLVKSGFESFYFGLESSAQSWQCSTGGKVNADEFTAAVRHLKDAGAKSIMTYIIVGHPDSENQDPESSIQLAHQCGTKVILSEFSPIPGTVDGTKCTPWADMEEPLSHNKTAFAIRRLGADYLNELKALKRSLNA